MKVLEAVASVVQALPDDRIVEPLLVSASPLEPPQLELIFSRADSRKPYSRQASGVD